MPRPELHFSVAEELLQAAVNKTVSEKLNEVLRKAKDLSKDMSEEKKQEAAPMILQMMEFSTLEFFQKMRHRASSLKKA